MIDTSAHTDEDTWFADTDQCWCGGHSRTPSPHWLGYLACERCGTHFSARRLKAGFVEQSQRLHLDQTRRPRPAGGPGQQSFETDGRLQRCLDLVEQYTGGGRGMAVEAGCADGTLLLHLRQRGWQTVGFGPDSKNASAAGEHTGLEPRAGGFPAANVPRCELFIAWDVLGRAQDPLAFLSAAHERLRPGGLLFLHLSLPATSEGPGAPAAPAFDPEGQAFVFSHASLGTLLETAGFEVKESLPGPSGPIAFALRVDRPARAVRHLANLSQMFSREWTQLIDELNTFGAPHGLRQFSNWSKLWEYPWLWHHGLSALDWRGRRVVDLGSEQSPFPWWLAAKGAQVTLVETRRDWIGQWETTRAALGGVNVDWQIVDSCRLPFADGSIDVVTSLSVIEHQDDKPLAFREVARVLKPGGVFAASFDICEPSMGMTFPEWNGRALTMREFEELVAAHPEFALPADFAWNLEDIPSFLRWHRQTAPHHNYVTGAAVLKKQPAGPLARLRRWFT